MMSKTKTASPLKATVTIGEILKATKLTRRTFNRWMEAGLVPRPRMVPGTSGRGQVGVWDPWVINRAKRIRALQAAGVPLGNVLRVLEQEIVSTHESRIAAAARVVDRWFEPGSGKDALKAVRTRATAPDVVRALADAPANISVTDVFRAGVEHMARNVGLSNDKARQIGERAAERAEVHAAITMMFRGFNPVLLWDGTSLVVMPDVLVPEMFGPMWWAAGPRGHDVMMPVSYIVLNAWPVVRSLMTNADVAGITGGQAVIHGPVYLPARRVVAVDRSDAPALEYPFRLTRKGLHAAHVDMDLAIHQGRPVEYAVGERYPMSEAQSRGPQSNAVSPPTTPRGRRAK